METKLTVRFKRGGRRPRSHGGYSYLTTGTLPEHRANILRYLMAARQGLVCDLGPIENDLTTAQIILIDRVVTKLGVVRCIEEHIRENSVMVGNDCAAYGDKSVQERALTVAPIKRHGHGPEASGA